MAMLRLPTATPAVNGARVRQWKSEGLLLFPNVEVCGGRSSSRSIIIRRAGVKCSSSSSGGGSSSSSAVVNLGDGTPVRSTNILVVGATGTLGRQIVRRALDEGYDVRCLVRPRPAPADFLRDWGATVVNADLTKPETIPATLVGVHTVIDCATGRPEEPIKTVDWEGKVALIQCAKAMGIQKYVFYSIHNCDKHPEVPLMEIKYCTENFLRDSGLNHIVIRLCGFMQVSSLSTYYLLNSNIIYYQLTTIPPYKCRVLSASMPFLSWKKNLFGELTPQPESLTWTLRLLYSVN
jgi:hypothetical protein